MNGNRLVIRADASSGMGVGHVMRCLALAQAWSRIGGEVVFVGHLPAGVCVQLEAEGFAVLNMCGSDFNDPLPILEAAPEGAWVIVDGYHFSPELTHQLRAAKRRVLAISDSPDQSAIHEAAHILLNTGYGAEKFHYQTCADSVRLMGQKYVLLRPEFRAAARQRELEPEQATRVLVSFGGADSAGMSERAAGILGSLDGPSLEVKVVVGKANFRHTDIERAFATVGIDVEILSGCDEMALLMDWADLGFAAAGITALEMACAGLPAVLVVVAENQRFNLDGLVASGAALCPDGVEFSDMELGRCIAELLDDQVRRQACSDAGREYLDGLGSERVCSIMQVLAGNDNDEFLFRASKAGDLMQFFHLANDPDVRANSFSPKPIELKEHKNWFIKRQNSALVGMYVLDCHGVLAAQVRYEAVDDIASADYSVHPAFRGRGLGAKILAESCQPALKRLQVRRLRGEVLLSNLASGKCFLRAGFLEREVVNIRGNTCHIFEYGE